MKATLFDAEDPSDAYRTRLEAFLAPVAANAAAVHDDTDTALAIAEEVYEAYGDIDSARGLTRAQLVERCKRVCPDTALIDERIGVFIRMGMLHLPKTSQQRYLFNPEAAAALAVFGRLAEDGGVQELLTLLDRTADAVTAGTATHATVSAALRKIRRMFSIHTAHLRRLVADEPHAELIAQRRHHRAADRLLRDAKHLIDQVTTRHPDLASAGDRVIFEATQYTQAVQNLMERLLDESGRRRDFSMLDPEQYRTAAQTCTVTELAVPFERVLFDPPHPAVDVAAVLDLLDTVRPRPVRKRPVRTEAIDTGPDPVDAARERKERILAQRVARAEAALQGQQDVDLTSRLQGAGWPAAGQMVVDLIALDAHPDQPYTITMSDALLVDADGSVTYLSPVTVHRAAPALAADTPAPQDRTDETVVTS
ncbi:hypothetical protein [Cellulomonas fimi]|uniref:hypothetical protein n=1 Tax=Cellulomonas fimi TaxID=1708 RepID=UPI002359232A|nr:hypothetical protein [Cellulomonas fimi]